MRIRFEVIPYTAELPPFFGSRAPVNFLIIFDYLFDCLLCLLSQAGFLFSWSGASDLGPKALLQTEKEALKRFCTLGCMDMLLIQGVPMGSMKPESWQYLLATNHTCLHQCSKTFFVRFDQEKREKDTFLAMPVLPPQIHRLSQSNTFAVRAHTSFPGWPSASPGVLPRPSGLWRPL